MISLSEEILEFGSSGDYLGKTDQTAYSLKLKGKYAVLFFPSVFIGI
jgi:hypothetical protein